MKLGLALTSIAVLLARGRCAGAAEGDGVYGRLDGDIDWSPGLGAQVGEGGPSVVLGGRALFLGTVGVYGAITEAVRDGSTAARTVSLGAAFRPFFIPRWGLDLEHGPALIDLTIDAITFDFGVMWATSQGRQLSDRPGFEVALGTEVPLLGRAAGPWIGVRGALRFRGQELTSDSVDRLGPALAFTLSWHFLTETHLVDYRDRSPP